MDNPQPRSLNSLLARRGSRLGAIALLVLLLLATIFARSGIFRNAVPAPPPLPCDASTLQMGSAKFRIQTLAPASNKELNVPSGKQGIAFWVQGTNAHYVFALSPTSQNLAFGQRLTAGDPVKINWADCSSDEYVISSLAKTVADPASLLDQSAGGITVFVPKTSSSDGWLVEGKRPGLSNAQTPEPANPNAIQAEITFLDQTASPDGKTLELTIAVKNTGSNVIHLSASDISLMAANAAALAPSTVEPGPPIDIQPSASETLTITFSKPAANTAVFKILDFSVDLYF